MREKLAGDAVANVRSGEPEQLRHGRLAAQRRRRNEAIRRVRAYQRWLKSGSDLRRIPAIPSSADFWIARGGR